MLDAILHSDWGMILFGLSFGGILLLNFLRLDELVLKPKNNVKSRRHALLFDRDGEPLICDPDGRTWSGRGSPK